MTRKDHLLWIVAEECAELAQRASKMARFGPMDVEPGELLNVDRFLIEYCHLLAAMEMLVAEGIVPPITNPEVIAAKKRKVEEFLRYSAEHGTLTVE